MSARILVLLGCFISLFTACQKVIDVPLNEADKELVVEVLALDEMGNNYAKISRSGSIYVEKDFEQVNDATIRVTSSAGDDVLFTLTEDGYYTNPDFKVAPETDYFLSATVDGQEITATSRSRKMAKIDSLTFDPLYGGYSGLTDDTLYLVAFHATDDFSEENYYWMKIYRNGVENEGYYLGDDKLINGQYFYAYFFGSEAEPRDTVMVEMIAMDKANYNYLIGVSNIINDSGLGVAPANPPTNLTGTRLGVFGAFITDTMSIILP
jgi:hypothetical protein